MTNLLSKIMAVCSQQMACSSVFCPYLACSFGAHIFNLHNQENNIVTSGVKPRNVKMNVILVSPPGLSKNESIYRFIGKNQYSILTILDKIMDELPDGTKPPFCEISGEITSAGFVGTVNGKKDDGDDDNEEYGDAYIYRKGIIAYTEIASLFVKNEHSKDLINHVLRVMGDNQIVKRLAHKKIYHDTYVTIWGAIQPERLGNIDNSGMDRRAIYVYHEWAEEEIEEIKEFRVNKKTPEEIEQLKNDISSLRSDILAFIDRVKLIDEVNWYFDRKEFASMPADIDLIEGLCIGYALITENPEDTTLGNVLDIRMTPELEAMLRDIQIMKGEMKISLLDEDTRKLRAKTPKFRPTREQMKDVNTLEHPELSPYTIEGLMRSTGLTEKVVRNGMRQLCIKKYVHEDPGARGRKFYSWL